MIPAVVVGVASSTGGATVVEVTVVGGTVVGGTVVGVTVVEVVEVDVAVLVVPNSVAPSRDGIGPSPRCATAARIVGTSCGRKIITCS
jgi:hypothetical protein